MEFLHRGGENRSTERAVSPPSIELRRQHQVECGLDRGRRRAFAQPLRQGLQYSVSPTVKNYPMKPSRGRGISLPRLSGDGPASASPQHAMAHVYFRGDGEPEILLITLDASTSEADFDRRALAAALMGAPSSVH